MKKGQFYFISFLRDIVAYEIAKLNLRKLFVSLVLTEADTNIYSLDLET